MDLTALQPPADFLSQRWRHGSSSRSSTGGSKVAHSTAPLRPAGFELNPEGGRYFDRLAGVCQLSATEGAGLAFACSGLSSGLPAYRLCCSAAPLLCKGWQPLRAQCLDVAPLPRGLKARAARLSSCHFVTKAMA